jgi:hypothetical protein
MRPEDVRRLIGGYATGTLTDAERRALLEAALRDQELFNELAREQALKDLLEDPLARRELLHALEEKQTPAAAFTVWWKRPATWALAGGLATAALLVAVFIRPTATQPKPEPVLMAKREAPHAAVPIEGTPQAPAEPRAMAPAPARPGLRPGAGTEQIRDLQKAGKAGAETTEAEPVMDAAQPLAAEAVKSREVKLSRASGGAMASAYRAALAERSAAVPYRLLRADEAGGFTEAGASAVFRREEQVRVVFEPKEDGRLVVVSGTSETRLLDASVTVGGRTNLDVPAGETRLIVTFTPAGEPGAAPFEIRIRRE